MIDFFVDFEFRSRILQKLIGLLFNEAVRRMVAAFETRAQAALRRPRHPGRGRSTLPPGGVAGITARRRGNFRPPV